MTDTPALGQPGDTPYMLRLAALLEAARNIKRIKHEIEAFKEHAAQHVARQERQLEFAHQRHQKLTDELIETLDNEREPGEQENGHDNTGAIGAGGTDLGPAPAGGV